MSSDQIIAIPEDQPLSKWSEDDFKSVSSGGWLGRVQLMGGNTELVKAGKFPLNHYAHITDKETIDDLGLTVDCACITWRPKALDMSGDEIINVYDPKDPEFQRIQDLAGVKDSMCMFGTEFLIWLPTLKKFALFYMGTASARRESPQMMALLQKAVTLDSKYVNPKNSPHSWQAPVVKSCSTPFELPSEEALKREIYRFNNPPVVETVAESDGEERER